MPNSELGQKILAENEALRTEIEAHTKAMTDLAERVENAEDSGKHTRWIAYGLAAVLVLGGGWMLWDEVQDNSRYLKQGCEAGNEQRAKQKAIFDSMYSEEFALAEQQGIEIPQDELDALDRIYKTIEEAYPQRDCSKVSEGEVVNFSPVPTTESPAR